jgi:two-component system, NarL family, response regulator YdfI
MMRVLIKASSPITQAGLESVIRAHSAVHVMRDSVGVGRAGEDAEEFHPEVVLAEIDSPEDEGARELLDWAAEGVAVILLVEDPTTAWIADALRAGVKAILPRRLLGPELVAAVDAVGAGLVVLHPSTLETLSPVRAPGSLSAPLALVEPLTPREIEVLGLLAGGLGNKELAARLSISEHTVKFHVASIMGKLGATSRTEAVTIGIRHGLIMV